MEPVWDRPILRAPDAPPYSPFRIVPGFLTERQCDRALELGRSAEPEPAEVERDDGSDLDEAIRRSRTSWIAPGPRSDWLYRKIAGLAQRANRQYGFDLTGFVEDLQFTVYEAPGGFYTWHQDGLDGALADRKLTIVVQLSDPADYQGGELQFFEVVDAYDRDELVEFTAQTSMRGTAVVFPAFEQHRVLPVTDGTRCSLVAWVAGPPFR